MKVNISKIAQATRDLKHYLLARKVKKIKKEKTK